MILLDPEKINLIAARYDIHYEERREPERPLAWLCRAPRRYRRF
jgi:hypothetical protein